MNLRDSLQAFRRRLLIVVAALVVGVIAGWVTAPGVSRRVPIYQATHTLIFEPRSQSSKIDQVALLATSGDVPSRVATRLQLDRADVRSALSAVADQKVGTISITARNADPARAASLADFSGEELRAQLEERDRAAFEAELGRLTEAAESARKRFQAGKTPSEQNAARGSMEAADRSLSTFKSAGPPKPELRTLESATAKAAKAVGVKIPESRPARAVMLGILGLLIGGAGALFLERLDSRIRSKRAAEAAFGTAVVAEVPVLRKSPEAQLLTRTQPSSQFVEAYRGLRTYVALWAPPKAALDDGHRVIVVTSPAPGEGKTTTVAHLAAMLAEIGRSVVVISGDLRRPRLHQYFERSADPGLVDVLSGAPDAPNFSELLLSTPVRGVRLIPSGRPIENPAPLFEHCGDLLRAVRGLAEFVLVDSPPLLLANDAVDLARHADGVLLVARSGGTGIEAAEQSSELLKRLEIPVVGVVLTGSEAVSGASRYYSSRYYREPEPTSRLRRRVVESNGQRPTADTATAPGETSQPSSAESTESALSEKGDGQAMSAGGSAWVVNGHPATMAAAGSTWVVNGHAGTMTAVEEKSEAASTESVPDAIDP